MSAQNSSFIGSKTKCNTPAARSIRMVFFNNAMPSRLKEEVMPMSIYCPAFKLRLIDTLKLITHQFQGAFEYVFNV